MIKGIISGNQSHVQLKAKALKLDVDEILDVLTSNFVGITFDKVFMKPDTTQKKVKSIIRYFINEQEVSGFIIKTEGKTVKKSLFISISNTL